MRIPFLLLILFFLAPGAARAQYARADAIALSVDAPAPDSLAHLLTAALPNDRDKVRAIFRWITANIRYQLRTPAPLERKARLAPDTAFDSRPADERIAAQLLRRREGVCDGYARLFNALCGYAGIRSALVRGYVRNDSDPTDRLFAPNHSWNAVWFDSAWHLLDATWAAGYVRNGSNEFTPAFDEFYFLTPPRELARNHLPEDLNWTLLSDPPLLAEFRHGPFRTQNALKYRVQTVSPTQGILHAAVGDTLRFRVELHDPLQRGSVYHAEPDWAPAALLHGVVGLDPDQPLPARELSYTYVVRPGDEWLQLRCDGEVILHYRVEGPARTLRVEGAE